ncbi:MAG: 30S ribosomal protein S6 [Gemmatimonadota bacterium]|nr:30S ribosomal protein S6 [Gemmatimonadota bacterium]
MKKYETVLILDPTLEDSEVEEKSKQIEELFKAEGVEQFERTDWGKRKLAYPIKKKENGIYQIFRFHAEPSAISELERRLKLDEQVLRSLIVLYVPSGVEQAVEAPAEETAEAPVEETVEAPVEKTAEAPAEETAEAPVEETAEAPVEKTAEAPAEEETEEKPEAE